MRSLPRSTPLARPQCLLAAPVVPFWSVSINLRVRQTQVGPGKNAGRGCTLSCDHGQSTSQHREMGDRKSIKPMTNAVYPISSIVRRKLSSRPSPSPPGLRTNPARMTLTRRDVCIAHQKFRLQTRHLCAAPSSIEPPSAHTRRILHRQNCLAKTVFARTSNAPIASRCAKSLPRHPHTFISP
ncbi:hypothetical protein F5888DRAFT_1100511 [Russula emetica]|nr:hypothetical protein F5888DRAFT_1100511 [Russula emetica]